MPDDQPSAEAMEAARGIHQANHNGDPTQPVLASWQLEYVASALDAFAARRVAEERERLAVAHNAYTTGLMLRGKMAP